MGTAVFLRKCLPLVFSLPLATACSAGGVSDMPGGGDTGGDGSGSGDGSGGGGGGGDAPSVAYRMDSLSLIDPHVFAFGSTDVTGTVNDLISEVLTGDDDGDGFLDLSVLLVFNPLDPDRSDTDMDLLLGADCSAPGGTSCVPGDSQIVPVLAENGQSACLSPKADTVGDYDHPNVPGGPCFASGATNFELEVGDLIIPLAAGQVAARYADGTLSEGLLSGFLSREIADATPLPDDLPLVGGDPVSSLLQEDDVDSGPAGEEGWWFYLDFTAVEVTYTE